MESSKTPSLAELRSQVKNLRKELYKPISRSKKSDLIAELERHRGVTSPSSTKQEVVVPVVEEQPKKEKAEKQGKKAEKPKAEKKETKSDKVKEPKEKKSKSVKKEKKSE